MNIITGAIIVVNIILIAILLTALFYSFKTPKNKAMFGYAIVGGLLLYLVFLGLYIILELLIKQNFNVLYLIVCLLSPFVIGYFVKYNTLKKYTFIQILFLFSSLIYILINSYNY